MLNVYTATLHYRGPDRLDVSRQSGSIFAPSWKLLKPFVEARKNGRETEQMRQQFADAYIEEMRIYAKSGQIAQDEWKHLLAREGGMRDELARLGATATGLRLVMHPDQYVVLSSDTPHVVENASQALIMHGKILDLLGQPRSAAAAVIIHGGKGGRSAQLARQIELLPDPVRSRLVLENDERAYSASEILGVCRDTGIPMVFDAHHHVVHESLDSYDHPSVAAALWAAANTWKDPSWQLTHISNGRDGFRDRRHSDFISVMPASYREAPWIEVEAKAKEQAVARLHDMGW